MQTAIVKISKVTLTPGQRIAAYMRNIDLTTALNNHGIPLDKTGSDLASQLLGQVKQLYAAAVDTHGHVDYKHIDGDLLEAYRHTARLLSNFSPNTLQSRDDQLAFWINLYNALVIDGVLHFGITSSIQEVRGFFAKVAYVVNGYRFSADDIEHGILRANAGHPAIPGPQFHKDDPRRQFVVQPLDSRIHYTLVCASESCPPINFYSPEIIDKQLTLAATNFVNGGEYEVHLAEEKITLSKIFQWYAPDFGGSRLNQLGFGDFSAVVRNAGQYLVDSPEKEAVLGNPGRFKVRFKAYDWSLNRTGDIN